MHSVRISRGARKGLNALLMVLSLANLSISVRRAGYGDPRRTVSSYETCALLARFHAKDSKCHACERSLSPRDRS